MIQQERISKRDYLTGLRCIKSLYLQNRNPELAEENLNRLILEQGLEFQKVARELIAPGGICINESGNIDDHILRTQTALQKDNVILYEAAFRSPSGETVRADVLVKKDEKISITEIKAVTSLMDLHVFDTAYTYWCIVSSGTKVDAVDICSINKDYVRNGPVDKNLLLIQDFTLSVKKLYRKVDMKIQHFRKVLRGKNVPEIELGYHCLDSDLEPCPFRKHCFGGLPANNIFELRSMRTARKLQLYYHGTKTMEQLANLPNINLTDGQIIQITSAIEKDKETVFQPGPLREWLEPLKQPAEICFMDFETIAEVIPLEGCKSYAQIPFQWSAHCRHGNSVQHYDYLHDPNASHDPRKEFLESLLYHLGDRRGSPVVVWNAAFEKSVLKNLAKLFPEHEARIASLLKRIVDLADVYRNKWHYDSRFRGSWSLKAVVPVVCPELSYDDLNVSDGASASWEYYRLRNLSGEKADAVRQALRKYCERDTLTMVRILEFLFRITN